MTRLKEGARLDALFRRGRKLAVVEGILWDELSGAEKNQYYARAEESLEAERDCNDED